MNTKLIILFSLLAPFCYGQIDSADYYEKVIGFIPKSKTIETDFYDKPNGKIIESIGKPKHGWIQMVILKQNGNWVQIKSASIAPVKKQLDKLNETWIEISNIWINLSNDSSRCYAKPDLGSKYFTVEFKTVELLEIKGNWAKAKFINDNQEFEGWFRKEDQCGSPWTTCNY